MGYTFAPAPKPPVPDVARKADARTPQGHPTECLSSLVSVYDGRCPVLAGDVLHWAFPVIRHQHRGGVSASGPD